VPPGDYLVVAYLGNPDTSQDFHEVFRHVPDLEARKATAKHRYNHVKYETNADGFVELAEIKIFATSDVKADMAFIPAAGDYPMGSDQFPGTPPHRRQVPAYYLDCTEVTIAALTLRGWRLPPRLQRQPPPENYPVTCVTYHDAVAYAEAVGKRLMEETEFEVAATRAGTQAVPWKGTVDDIEIWEIGPVTPRFDVIAYDRPIYGLYSNAVEWTSSWCTFYPGLEEREALSPFALRIVRGGSADAATNPDFPGEPVVKAADPRASWARGPRWREAGVIDDMVPVIGFRCARSSKPRIRAADFISIIRK